MRSRGVALILMGLLGCGACSTDAAGSAPTTTGATDARPSEICTLIGCTSGVFWRFDDSVGVGWPRPLTFEACIDDHCDSEEIGPGQMVSTHRTSVGLYDGIDLRAEHVVTVRLAGPDGRVLIEREDVVTLSSVQPNGSSCPPTCWQAIIEVDSAG